MAKPEPPQLVYPAQPGRWSRVGPAPDAPTHETPVVVPEALLRRHGARLLDPQTASQPDENRRAADNGSERPASAPVPYRATAYLPHQMLLYATGLTADRVRSIVTAVNDELASRAKRESDPSGAEAAQRPPQPDTLFRLVPDRTDLERLGSRAATRSPAVVRLAIESPSAPVDAWRAVQIVRDLRHRLAQEKADDQQAEGDTGSSWGFVRVGLNHLLLATPLGGVASFGHASFGHASFGHASFGHGSDEYAAPGLGGRSPVRLVLPKPCRQPLKRRPVVAILDTGVAEHFWFDPTDEKDPIVERLRYNEQTTDLESADEVTGGEPHPNLIDPLEGVTDPLFGHGTFIAGLIHQCCPDARILSVKLMGTDGVVTDDALINSLGGLHARHVAAVRNNKPREQIDVVSLSLGYYSEEPTSGGRVYDAMLHEALDALGREGVVVVAAAGNDSTHTPLLPAGFSSFQDGQLMAGSPTAPLISVGALNPDNSVALFSNDGPWVACHAPGAAVVSTLPRVDNGLRASIDSGFERSDVRAPASSRATIDPDGFWSGFGVWSGTSFAAPVVAGAVAAQLTTIDLAAEERGSIALKALGFEVGS